MGEAKDAGMTLRPLEAGDFDGLWPIFREIIREGATYVQDETTTRDEFVDYWRGRGGEQWVAAVGDAVVGGYTLRPNHPGRGSHVATASYVVGEAARGRGVGRALGEHSLERARAAGYRAVQFNMVISTNAGAVALWKRLGFEVVGTLPGAFRHAALGLVDAYVMYRAIEPAED